MKEAKRIVVTGAAGTIFTVLRVSSSQVDAFDSGWYWVACRLLTFVHHSADS